MPSSKVRHNPIANFFRVASVLLLLVAVTLFSAILTMRFAIHGAEVQVPDLSGMTVAQARSETAGLGLNLDVDNRYYSGAVAAGHILTQSPRAGTVVRREWHVRVAESLGPQRVDVPNTVGSDQRAAELELRRAGLDVAAEAYLPDPDAPEGTVLAQDPPPHAQDIAQPAVSLLLAAPGDEPPNGYVMPDMTGWQAKGAVAELTRLGMQTAPLHYVDAGIPSVGASGAAPTAPAVPGAILTQLPVPGARVGPGTMVTLSVVR